MDPADPLQVLKAKFDTKRMKAGTYVLSDSDKDDPPFGQSKAPRDLDTSVREAKKTH